MNKTEILNIVNEPSKHIQIVKIDGKDSIVYSSKFVELLELIPTMLTKADMVDMLVRLNNEIDDLRAYDDIETVDKCEEIIQQKINKLKEKSNEL